MPSPYGLRETAASTQRNLPPETPPPHSPITGAGPSGVGATTSGGANSYNGGAGAGEYDQPLDPFHFLGSELGNMSLNDTRRQAGTGAPWSPLPGQPPTFELGSSWRPQTLRNRCRWELPPPCEGTIRCDFSSWGVPGGRKLSEAICRWELPPPCDGTLRCGFLDSVPRPPVTACHTFHSGGRGTRPPRHRYLHRRGVLSVRLSQSGPAVASISLPYLPLAAGGPTGNHGLGGIWNVGLSTVKCIACQVVAVHTLINNNHCHDVNHER